MSVDNVWIIKWRDHHSIDGWTDPDLLDLTDYIVTTVGYRIMENEDYVALASTASDTGMVNSIMVIIKKDILEQKDLGAFE